MRSRWFSLPFSDHAGLKLLDHARYPLLVRQQCGHEYGFNAPRPGDIDL
jgi:hypothetical protein